MTAPYSRFEAWGYDRLVAPAVADLKATVVDRFLHLLPSGARLLDVGCGGGQISLDLARRRADLEVTGLDLSASQVARAEGRARAAGVRARYVQGSALALPFDDASFDAVLSVASIKHWPDQAKGLSECARVLRRGGGLVVVEADRGCRLPEAASFVSRWRIPAVGRPFALAVFRTWVAGQAIDLDDARRLLATLPVDGEVSRIDGLPALLLMGTRR